MWIEDPAVRAVRIASTQPSAVSRSTYDNPHVCVTASHGIDDEASACAILSGILIDLGLAVFHRPQCTVGCIFHFDLRCHPDDQLPNTRLHVMLILCYIPTFFSPHGSRRPVARRPVRVVLSRVNRSRSVNVGKVEQTQTLSAALHNASTLYLSMSFPQLLQLYPDSHERLFPCPNE